MQFKLLRFLLFSVVVNTALRADAKESHFAVIVANMDQGLADVLIQVRFLPVWSWFAIMAGSLFAGWLGCYLSLKQFLFA